MLLVDDISVAYGRKRILEHCSFSLEHGEIVGLVAPNGFGKTTLMRTIAGLIVPRKGRVSLDKIQASSKERYFRKLFFIDDTSLLNPGLSPWDYLKYFQAINKSTLDIQEIAQTYRIQHFKKKPFGKLSSGMRQQAVIALADASNAPYMLLDEPFNNLDPTNTQIAMQNIKKMNEKGRAVLISSHLLSSLDDFCDRVVFMCDGAVVKKITTHEGISTVSVYEELYSGLLERQ